MLNSQQFMFSNILHNCENSEKKLFSQLDKFDLSAFFQIHT